MRVGVFTYDTMHNYRFFGNNRTVKRYEKRKVTGASLVVGDLCQSKIASSFFHNYHNEHTRSTTTQRQQLGRQ